MKILLTALFFLGTINCSFACVTYSPSSGKYTVDKSGCVNADIKK